MGGINLDLRRKVPEALAFELPDFADAIHLGLVRDCLCVGGRAGRMGGRELVAGVGGGTGLEDRRLGRQGV